MNKQEFIQRVLHILNESESSIEGTELYGADANSIAAYIDKQFPAAWRRAVKIFPRTWFNVQTFATATHAPNPTEGTGYVILPDDYLVLVRFKMHKWETDCMEAHEEDTLTARKQSNEYLRGTPQRPVCVIRLVTHESAIRKSLHYYSLPLSTQAATHVIETAHYIPNVKVFSEETILSEALAEPLAYLTAATILTSFEKETAAKAIESKILEMI